MLKRLSTLLLALIMSLSCVALADDVIEFPFVEEGSKVTLTIAFPVNTQDTPSVENLWVSKYLEEKTGIDLQFIEIDSSVVSEKLNLMYSSGELPDMLIRCNIGNLQVLQYGVGSHLFAPMNELIEEYAPNIKAVFEEYPTLKAQCTAPDGNIYVMRGYSNELDNQVHSDQRAWINQKWLDNLGLDRPTTLDEMYDVLVAFRDDDPNGNGIQDEIPFCDSVYSAGRMIWAAYGVVTLTDSALSPSMKDGEMIIPVTTEMYRSYLETLNQWYTEGLIDNDAYTLTAGQMQAKNAEGIVGAHVQAAPHTMISTGWEDYEHWPALTSEYSDTPVWPAYARLQGGNFAISAKCENKEVAMRLIDWFYTEEGALYCHYGPIEGSDVEGDVHGWYFDEAGNGPLHHRDENDGYSSDLFYRNANIGFGGGLGLVGPFRAIEEIYGIVAAGRTGAAGHWRRSTNEYMAMYNEETFPVLFMSEEDGNALSELSTPLNDYRSQMEAKFVTGQVSFDEFDAYIEHLYDIGLGEYIEIYENAWAIYKAGM